MSLRERENKPIFLLLGRGKFTSFSPFPLREGGWGFGLLNKLRCSLLIQVNELSCNVEIGERLLDLERRLDLNFPLNL